MRVRKLKGTLRPGLTSQSFNTGNEYYIREELFMIDKDLSDEAFNVHVIRTK